MIEWLTRLTDAERWGFGLFAMLIIGVISQWCGQRIGHALAIRRDRSSAIRSAVIQYKSAFAPEISAISNNSFALDTFSRNFHRHESAVDTIRPILPKRYQRKLQKVWQEYCGKCNGLGFDAPEFVSATGATFFLEERHFFQEFKTRFSELHSCLDDLL